MTVKPLSPYCFCNWTKCGISMRHGAHHVAQKSRIRTWPRKSEDFTSLLVRSVSSQSGAGRLRGRSLLRERGWHFQTEEPNGEETSEAGSTHVANAVSFHGDNMEDATPRLLFLRVAGGFSSAHPIDWKNPA